MIEALDNFNLDDTSRSTKDDDNEHSKEQYELDAKMKGYVKPKKKLDEEYIIGTAITLMQAGFDTTALTMSFLIYELALHLWAYPLCLKYKLNSRYHLYL